MLDVEYHSETVGEEPFAVESEVKIWVATDYSKFKLNEFNRVPSHYKKVRDSIREKDYTMYQPILVDKEMNIVDGQNRFLACKELGKPIYFIVSRDIKIYAAAEINQASKNWGINDYVEHYAKRHREPYIRMMDLAAKYKQKISVISHFGKMTDSIRNYSDLVKKGVFQFRDDINIDDFFEHAQMFQNYYDFADKERFIRALLRLYLHPEYKPSQMEEKLRSASAIVHDQPKAEMLIDELLKLYNFRARKPLQIIR
jgi:hypothetical protein